MALLLCSEEDDFKKFLAAVYCKLIYCVKFDPQFYLTLKPRAVIKMKKTQQQQNFLGCLHIDMI